MNTNDTSTTRQHYVNLACDLAASEDYFQRNNVSLSARMLLFAAAHHDLAARLLRAFPRPFTEEEPMSIEHVLLCLAWYLENGDVGLADEPPYTVTRTVRRSECGWLDEDVRKGTTVYLYRGPTYGCISPAGDSFTLKPDPDNEEAPFFELPRDAVSCIATVAAPTPDVVAKALLHRALVRDFERLSGLRPLHLPPKYRT